MIKKSFIMVVFLSLICVPLLYSKDIIDDNGNETWDLKERWLDDKGKMPHVMFPHTFHQVKNDYVCTKCHDSDDGGPFTPPGEIKGIDYSNAAHHFCWSCHQTNNVTQVGHTCSKCHISGEYVPPVIPEAEPEPESGTESKE